MAEKKISTVSQLMVAYKKGGRLFSGLEFENGESFQGADLSGSTFNNCWFAADFSGSNLESCNFTGCNLKTSDFSNSNLKGAAIRNCSVESTSWKGAGTADFIFEDNFCYDMVVSQEDFFKQFYIK